MSLFNQKYTKEIIEFNKEDVLQGILDILDKEFSSYKIIESKDDPWDLIIIRMVSVTLFEQKGALGIHEGYTNKTFQEVFVVNVKPFDEVVDEEKYGYSKGWSKKHIFAHTPQAFKIKLMELSQ